MIYNKQSLYFFKFTDKGLIVKPNKEKNKAIITKVVKMISSSSIEKKVYDIKQFTNKNIKNGIFRIYISYKKDNVKDDVKRFYYLSIESGKAVRQSSKYPKQLSGPVKVFDDELFRGMSLKIDDNYWKKLLNFYIIQNPSLNSGKNPTSAQYYNIKERWGFNCWQKGDTLKTRLIETIPNYNASVRHVSTERDMTRPLIELELMDAKKIPVETKICIVDVSQNIFLSIFRHIRNGLAHGRFLFFKDNEKTFLFVEDCRHPNVTARIVIDVEILIMWIDIIKYNA